MESRGQPTLHLHTALDATASIPAGTTSVLPQGKLVLLTLITHFKDKLTLDQSAGEVRARQNHLKTN